MFNLLRSAVTSAYNAIRGAVSKPAPKPAPKPVYTAPKIAAPPAPSFRPIANYGESAASIAARTRAWVASPAAKAQAAWIAAPSSAAAAAKSLAAQRAAAAAAEAARRAEAERLAARRRALQADLDGKRNFLVNAGKAAADKASGFLRAMTGKKTEATGNHDGFANPAEKAAFDKWFKLQTPERQAEVTRFNQIKNEYESKAKKTVDGTKKGVSGWFGYTANTNARGFAQKQVEHIATNQNKRYETTLNAFLKERTSKAAAFEAKKAAGTLTQKDVDEITAWEAEKIKGLEYTRAATTGMLAGYGSKASEKLNDPISRAGSWFNKNVTHGAPGKFLGGVWNISVGQGWKDVPSLATAPSRLLNTAINLARPNQQRNYHEGKTDSSGVKNLGDAWAKSFNQRNINMSQPFKGSKVDFERFLKSRDTKPLKAQGMSDAKIREYYKKAYEIQLRSDVSANYTAETFADPLMGVGKVGRGFSKVGKAAAAVAKPSWYNSGVSALKSLKNTKAGKAVSWLNADHKTYSQRKNDFVQEELDDIYTKRPEVRKLLTKWQQNKTDIKAAEKTRISEAVNQQFAKSIVDDAGMHLDKSTSERFLRAVQEVARGKSVDDLADFNPRERAAVGKLAQDLRTKLDDFYNAENTASLPRTNVTIDPRTGKKTFTRSKVQPVDSYAYRENYIPQYTDGFKASLQKRKSKKGAWWFTKEQKTQRIQSTKQLTKSLSAREYADTTARQNFPVQRDVVGGRKDIAENFDRIDNVDQYVKRTKWEKAMRVAGAPMRGWKKAVLLGNPAWYVNNELFNQIQGVSAGGLKFLKNQRGSQKYLKHVRDNANARMLPSKAQKMSEEIGSNVNKEVGGSFLGKLASKQETRSRVALYRTYRQDGLSHDKAIKKVNDNLFDYSTKNYERPIKSVAPFYSWTKGLTKASIKMPLQKPKTAIGFNEVDRNQKAEYDKDFDSVVPALKKQGYTDEQIKEMREFSRKFYADKTKIGGADGASVYMSTPFNAFSERGLSNAGFNPFFSAIGEAGDAVDYYGNPLKGDAASLLQRLVSKFPQPNLAKQGYDAWKVYTGKAKPSEGWIGAKGSEGYGLTKEKQGYDPGKANYTAKMDPRTGLLQNTASFMGSPRFSVFDKNQLVEGKKLEKVKEKYFALDTKNMKYPDAEAARAKIFKDAGITADEFYKGVLSKYDTDNTKRIKGQKEEAAAKNKSLFEEYGKQPKGTRNLWATQKLRELVAQGYFDKNPFLKSFDWMSGESVNKADKQLAYQEAKRTGNWTSYNSRYGKSAGLVKKEMYDAAKRSGDWTKWRAAYGSKTSEKKKAYDRAKSTGDWTAYRKDYGDNRKESAFTYEGKHFKTAASLQKYKDGLFWMRYAEASRADRKALLAANPEYDTRKNWTDKQWDDEKSRKKNSDRTALRGWSNFAAVEASHLATNKVKAGAFIRSRSKKTPKLSWRLS